MSEQRDDVVLRYCIARDTRNLDVLVNILEVARVSPGLKVALSSIHLRFNRDESWTNQLLAYRRQFQECLER